MSTGSLVSRCARCLPLFKSRNMPHNALTFNCAQVCQTQLQVEALQALAALSQDAHGVCFLSKQGTWLTMLKATAASPQCTCALSGAVLSRAIQTAPSDFHVCQEGMRIIIKEAESDVECKKSAYRGVLGALLSGHCRLGSPS